MFETNVFYLSWKHWKQASMHPLLNNKEQEIFFDYTE